MTKSNNLRWIDMSDTRELKKFGQTMAIAFLVIGGFLFWRRQTAWPYLLAVAAMFQLMTWLWAAPLEPIQRVWMKFGHALGWMNTRIILSVIFFIFMTPIRLILLMMGKDLLDEKLEREKKSYWKSKEPGSTGVANYERLY